MPRPSSARESAGAIGIVPSHQDATRNEALCWETHPSHPRLRKSFGDTQRETGMGCLEEELRSIVGAANLFAGGDIEERYTADITHKYHSHPGLSVRPADTGEI